MSGTAVPLFLITLPGSFHQTLKDARGSAAWAKTACKICKFISPSDFCGLAAAGQGGWEQIGAMLRRESPRENQENRERQAKTPLQPAKRIVWTQPPLPGNLCDLPGAAQAARAARKQILR
jgi:hypothetical protein